MPKPVIPREKARQDMEEAVQYYLEQAGGKIAESFVSALEQATIHISEYPTSGSLRLAQELNIPGLRSWSLQRYPYLMLYIEHPGYVELVRVLHGQRDIPESFKKML